MVIQGYNNPSSAVNSLYSKTTYITFFVITVMTKVILVQGAKNGNFGKHFKFLENGSNGITKQNVPKISTDRNKIGDGYMHNKKFKVELPIPNENLQFETKLIYVTLDSLDMESETLDPNKFYSRILKISKVCFLKLPPIKWDNFYPQSQTSGFKVVVELSIWMT